MGEFTDIPSLDGEGAIPAYQSRPAEKTRGAIVVVQEIFGINHGIRARCDRWAEAGYVALAPELFFRFAPGLDLDPDVPDQLQQGFAAMQRFDKAQGVQDIAAAIRAAREAAGARKVAVIGYCLGGQLAYLAGARTDADATVAYYPGGIDGVLDEAHAIANPMLIHFAERDHFIGEEVRAKAHAALDGNAHVAIHEYPGVDHGFATEEGERRDETQARIADDRTAAFIADHIG
jgi:carboxymethylenebutenolidase